MAVHADHTFSATLTKDEVHKLMRALQERGVRMRSVGAIERFLYSHPHVAPALEPTIVAAFDRMRGGEISLEVDGSSGSGSEYLVLVLAPAHYGADPLSIACELTTTARGLMSRPESRFIVTTDFEAPSAAHAV